jgi:hypothetical protein
MSSMQEKIPSSTPAQAQELPQYEQSLQEPMFNPENIEALKARARDLAIQQAIAARGMQPQSNPTPPPQIAQAPQAPPRPQPIPRQTYQQPVPEPNVVYLRRNLTIAEVLLILALSTGILAGVQFAWGFSTDILSRIEIREK